ncbi:hypothetical protein V1508DRAFT_401593 [Lipomyces doorenjongii]|uniref:uncharacterized protein n=1 Tax=Lipomyces doorenjongii TaxID=383834 RepID=UPI0034CECFC5
MSPGLLKTGIGLAIVLAAQLSEHGYIEKIRGTAIAQLNNVKFVEMEAVDYGTIDSAVAEIENIAPEGIDEVWNNLGVYKLGLERDEASIRSIDAVELETHFKVSVVAPTYFTSKLIPLLEKRQSKTIVFVSSAGSSLEVTKQSAEFFTSAGSALNMVCLYFHMQLQSLDFIVVPIHPGIVFTDMYVAGLGITAEESVVDPLTSSDEDLLRKYDGSTLPR